MTDRSGPLTSIKDINFRTGRPAKDRKLLKTDAAGLGKKKKKNRTSRNLKTRTEEKNPDTVLANNVLKESRVGGLVWSRGIPESLGTLAHSHGALMGCGLPQANSCLQAWPERGLQMAATTGRVYLKPPASPCPG